MVNESIRIFCRIKPSSSKVKSSSYEITQNDSGDDCLTLAVPKEQSEGLVNNKREQYVSKFRKVFDQSAFQDQVFDVVAKPVVDKVLEGFNGTVFAYGQTGSGKTFTVTGGAEKFSDRGLIPRTLSYIYEKRKSSLVDMEIGVSVSYLEIYNELGFDLLDPKHDITKLEDLPRVTIMEDSDGYIHLRNLSIQPAGSEEEALNLLFLGDTNRMIAETPMNQASTRSHCVFSIHVSMRRPGSDVVRRSKMHLVDLAGSERVSKTGVSGVLLTEAKYINLSLHHLEQVIVALSESGRTHVPYRNSLMTSVLRDSLGGNCITAMIATCSVERSNLLESISTCRFAQRVAQVKNDARVNEETDPTVVITRLKREVQQLRDQLNLTNGSQAVGPLTPSEVERCQFLVKQYISEPGFDSDMQVGADMRLIQYCYQLLKREIRTHVCPAPPAQIIQTPPPPAVVEQRIVLSDLDLAALTDPTGHLPPEVVKLKQIVQQRDNEISVLMAMLKREREKTRTMIQPSSNTAENSNNIQLQQQDSTRTRVTEFGGSGSSSNLKLARTNNNQTNHQANSSNSTSSVVGAVSNVHSVETLSSLLKDDPSMQSAFEAFVRQHPSRGVFESQRDELKRKYAEAKSAGDGLSASKDRVSILKTELDKIRAQIAVTSAVSSSSSTSVASSGGVDSVLADRESRLRENLEHERISYRNAVERLRSLRSEIEHLHHLHTSHRTKLLKEFDESQQFGDDSRASDLHQHHHQHQHQQPQQQQQISQNYNSRAHNNSQSFFSPSAASSMSLDFSNSGLPTTTTTSLPLQQSSAQRDFQLQQSNRMISPLSPSSSTLTASSSSSSIKPTPTSATVDIRQSARNIVGSTASIANTSSTIAATGGVNIPMTGDGEVDENIAAFLRARQVLMARAAANVGRPSEFSS